MRLADRLASLHQGAFVAYAGLAGFSAYFSMYAFRKPFTAATFSGEPGWDCQIDYKVLAVIAQALGYALSKWIGVGVIAETGREHRARSILILIGLSWVGLVLFAILPRPWNVLALFLNGLPLGLIWGLVFSYMEGRRVSDLLGAILCASFILSSGIVKAVGSLLLQAGVSEFWMPAAVGALFSPLLLLSVGALSQLPQPTAEDERARSPRSPMDGRRRMIFIRENGVGLALLIVAYVVFSAFRDLRDNFSADLWLALGHGDQAGVFVLSEVPVAVCVLTVLASLLWVRSNKKALLIIHMVMACGSALLGLATAAFAWGGLSGFGWVLCTGAGVYLVYAPFNAVLFDRLVAASGSIANAGFLIYLADASGYVGSVALLLYRSLAAPDLPWVTVFQMAAFGAALTGLACFAASALYFHRLR